jgi:hypothetical protein
MNKQELFSNSIYEEQTHLAERELSAFIKAVTELFGPEQARSATEDWLKEADLIDAPPLSTSRNWRSVTIAASARLSRRIDAPQHPQTSLSASTDTKVSPIPSCNCFATALLV